MRCMVKRFDVRIKVLNLPLIATLTNYDDESNGAEVFMDDLLLSLEITVSDL